MATTVPTTEQNNYAALRAAPATDLPRRVQDLPADAIKTYGANPALAHVTYPDGQQGDPWYVIPGNDSLCFYDTADAIGSCTTQDRAATGQLLVWELPHTSNGPGTAASQAPNPTADGVVGLVPDNVTSASAATRTGTVPVTISNNVLKVRADGITSLRLQTASGSTYQARVR